MRERGDAEAEGRRREGRRGQGRQWAPRSRPHLKEGPPVRRIEGVQGLLQPPLSGAGRHPRVQAQTQDGALLKTPDVLAEAPKERGCGPRGDSVQPSPPRSPCLNPGLLLPGAEDPPREARSRGPSHSAGPSAMLPSPRRGARHLHLPPGLAWGFIAAGARVSLQTPFPVKRP